MTRTDRIAFARNVQDETKRAAIIARLEAMTDAEYEADVDAANEKSAQHASDHVGYSRADATRGRW